MQQHEPERRKGSDKDEQDAPTPPARPEGGFAHEWPWEDSLNVPVHRDEQEGIAWVRVSECPPEERATLEKWIEERMAARPYIDGIQPQDALYVWDYAEFVAERGDY